MSIALVVLLVLAGVALLVAFWVIGAYNGLVTLRNRFKNAFAQIDVQLKRRYDLIPNLVETAKGYLKHERETLEAVIKARNIALAASQTAASNPADANAMKGLVSAETGLAGALSRLMVVSEQYPDLNLGILGPEIFNVHVETETFNGVWNAFGVFSQDNTLDYLLPVCLNEPLVV